MTIPFLERLCFYWVGKDSRRSQRSTCGPLSGCSWDSSVILVGYLQNDVLGFCATPSLPAFGAKSRFLASLEMTNPPRTIRWEIDFGETDPWETDWGCETESFGWDSDSFNLETDTFSWETTVLIRGWVDSVLLVLRDPCSPEDP